VYISNLIIFTDQYQQFQVITGEIEQIVEDSGIKNGVVTVQTKHTTTAITVNESLECLESDIDDFLKRLVPEDHPYAHARMLKDYGSTAGNPTGHIKSLITGNHCHFPIVDGQMIRGGAQEIYFCEFDGPSERTILIYIQEG
jgi:secondary thiamine-phosphate synthase enzyme